MPGVAVGATTVTAAPADNRAAILDSATGPAPTRRMGRPSSFTKMGNKDITFQRGTPGRRAWLNLGLWTVDLGLWTDMQSTFLRLRVFPPPTPRAFMFARLNGARARAASNARVSAVVQCVVRHVVLADVLP